MKYYKNEITYTNVAIQNGQEHDEKYNGVGFARHEGEEQTGEMGRIVDVNDQKFEYGHENGQQIEDDDAQPESVARIVEASVAGDHDANQQVDGNALGEANQVNDRLHPAERHWRHRRIVELGRIIGTVGDAIHFS